MIGGRLIKAGAALGVALMAAGCAVDDRQHYQSVVEGLRQQGGFRTATAPSDAPFTNEDLARNFIEIALHSEYEEGGLTETRVASTLSRWETPVRFAMAGSELTIGDKLELRNFTARMQRLTALDFTEVDDFADANFFVFLLNDEERDGYLELFEEKLGEKRAAFQRQWAENRRYPCVGQYYSDDESSDKITFAIVLIKAELGSLFRKSCIHEEVAQTLGLPNDSDDVRPSLFNDDEEFALLTHHDEFLLRILYDGRLRTGMTAEEVEPLLPEIIGDIRPDGKSRCCV